MQEFETIKFEVEEDIGIVTLNRPKALNAINTTVIEELGKVLDIIENDMTIRVVIITGEGRAFAAGADIAQMKDFNIGQGRSLASKGSRVMKRFEFLEQPTIAAINGFALGGGCELAMCCDMRIASENAKFGQPEVALGIMPGFSGTQRLPRIVGHAKAMEMILSGDAISAQEAEKIGLVNKVVKNEELMNEARVLARRILKNAPIAVRYAKLAIQRGSEQNIDAGIVIESAFFDLCFSTEDQKEGITAFLEKRKPNFQAK